MLILNGEDSVKEYGKAILMLGALMVLMYTRPAVIAAGTSYAKVGEVAGILLVAVGTLFSTGTPGSGRAGLWAGGAGVLFGLHHFAAARAVDD